MMRNKNRIRKNMRTSFNKETINPMENVANLVDVMLVFACALMIAIVTYWKVDLSNVLDVVDKEQLVEVEDLQESIKDKSQSDQYESKGQVFEDPDTGKMYIISD
ncbi:MAG: DUF2149 domain-containing protein [Eubacteriales bacterium]|nr:DUF2149 domain-containing protein [Eubacteriales bacterium]